MKKYEVRVEVSRMDEAEVEADNEDDAIKKGMAFIRSKYAPGRYCFGEPYAVEVDDGCEEKNQA